jgi:hypothetical protein
MYFFNADGLSRKDLAEVDLVIVQTDAPAPGDHDGLVMQRIIEIRQAGVGPWGRVVDFRRTLHVQRFVRAFVVEDVDKCVKPDLLLQEVGRGGLGGFFLQGEVHAFMTAVLLGMAGLDAFDANAEA